MSKLLLRAFTITLGLIGPAMAQERILISSDWGNVTAELIDNSATRSMVQMLPLTIEMRDHLRQEKTGNLPSPLPEVERRLDFSTGTLGLWSSNHLVIYYRDGSVPQPGIILLGQVTGDVSIFDRPGPVTVRLERIKRSFVAGETATASQGLPQRAAYHGTASFVIGGRPSGRWRLDRALKGIGVCNKIG